MSEEGAAAPAPEAPKTTTSGAHGLFQTNAWLTAAVVAAYSTRALWLKMRNLLGADKSVKSEVAEEPENMPSTVEAVSEVLDDVECEFGEPQPPGFIQTQVVNIYSM